MSKLIGRNSELAQAVLKSLQNLDEWGINFRGHVSNGKIQVFLSLDDGPARMLFSDEDIRMTLYEIPLETSFFRLNESDPFYSSFRKIEKYLDEAADSALLAKLKT